MERLHQDYNRIGPETTREIRVHYMNRRRWLGPAQCKKCLSSIGNNSLETTKSQMETQNLEGGLPYETQTFCMAPDRKQIINVG